MTAFWALAAAVLEGLAVLPADTFMPGPSSGHFISAPPGQAAPFPGQPVQGFSAVARDGERDFFVLADNGFGSRVNSPDFVLRIYSVSPDFRTLDGGSGIVSINGFINLADPYWRLGYPVTAQRRTYDGTPNGIPVHASIREQSWLTGADLDPESLVAERDGSFWIGDEFGPFVLHFSAAGELLEAPYSVPGLTSPDRHGLVGEAAIRRSAGFEGMGAGPRRGRLYAMLEKSIDPANTVLNLYAFDVAQRGFAGGDLPTFRYRLHPEAVAVGAFSLFSDSRGLVLERDDAEGEAANFKRIYRVDLGQLDEDGLLIKEELADLLDIRDPHDLDGDGNDRFSFPHWTIESVLLLDADRLLVINDNNYPFGRARHPDRPDGTEFIILRLDPPVSN